MARPTVVEGLSADTPLAEAAPRLLAARFEDVRRPLLTLLTSFEPEIVHEVRVATRRLRAAMRMLAGKKLKGEERDVKDLASALGALRDAHVSRLWLAEHRETAPPEEVPGLDVLTEELAHKIPALEERLARALVVWREVSPRLPESFTALRLKGRLGGKRVATRLHRRVAKVRKLLAKRSADPGKLHALRIAAKKLRYQAEVVADVFPDEVTPMLESLTSLQNELGAICEADVRMTEAEDALQRTDGEARRGLLILVAELERERDSRNAAAASSFPL
jgi:CHAD domain-containing protein